ncbi:hypothetical protein CAPTEDRAFT_210332 [Capitella teleta]|uniref:t-SNARE coiled-coil homology domain-containing protein n=1 Tax=Capitella teleta TaxID=283909 RepID=N1PB12_CAPTE|nr:hypothetical protein CAPTEDRAFT_210332 [Capitella teleta]|eukprot:ELU18858.1 hypothetical protein CAPTEDRAFT_210332 [Capitella teleta]
MSVYGINGGAISYANEEFSQDFTRLSLCVSSNTQQLIQYVAQLQRMVSQLGSSGDNQDLRQRIGQSQHEANSIAKETKKHLTELKHQPTAETQTEEIRRKVQRDRLMNEFMASLNRLQSVQRDAAEKEKESLHKAKIRRASSVEYDADMTEIRLDMPSSNPYTTQQHGDQIVEDDVDLAMLHEREETVRQLESDITDVNQIFKDLGLLVHDQGEVIDCIERSVEVASVQVEQGTEELRQAKEYKAKCRKKCCYLFIIILVVLGVIGLIIGITLATK